MEYRTEITELLKEGKSWKEISEQIELNYLELSAIASGRGEYTSGEDPLFTEGTKVLLFESEEEYYFGEVIRILPKRGELYPEYRYTVRWKDGGFIEEFWEQQIIDMHDAYDSNLWLL